MTPETSDVIDRLRRWAASICTVRNEEVPGSKVTLLTEAANEIETLRADCLRFRREVVAIKAEIRCELRHGSGWSDALLDHYENEICWELGWDDLWLPPIDLSDDELAAVAKARKLFDGDQTIGT